MAGAPWNFNVLPSTITEVTVTDGTTTVTLQKESLPGGRTFSTNSFAETSSVTVSATGYASKTATVGDAVVDLTFYVSSVTRSGITYQLKDAAATTALTTKADTDLSNVTNTGKSTSAGWAMPSSTYEALTVGANGAKYTAPSNGFFWFDGQNVDASSVAYVSTVILDSNNNALLRSLNWMPLVTASNAVRGFLPIQKNQVFQLAWFNITISHLYFVYAEGSKSEAN